MAPCFSVPFCPSTLFKLLSATLFFFYTVEVNYTLVIGTVIAFHVSSIDSDQHL